MNQRAIITKLIRDLGIPANVKGYSILREALELCVADPDKVHDMMVSVYNVLGKKVGETPSRVERSMRYAIEIAHSRGRDDYRRIFGAIKDKPSVSEFVATLTDELREFLLVEV